MGVRYMCEGCRKIFQTSGIKKPRARNSSLAELKQPRARNSRLAELKKPRARNSNLEELKNPGLKTPA
jgi:hypothetical protein